jgi:hypothetical protein
MSYSIRGLNYKSHLTGRAYPFVKDRDGGSKRAALARLNADEKAFRDAKIARGDLSTPAPLTHAQKVAEVKHTPKTDTNVPDAIGKRIAILERQLAHTRNICDRASIQRKINALGGRQEIEIEREQAKQVQAEFEASPAWIAANESAQQTAEQFALRSDPDLPESLVSTALDNKEFLRRNPSPDGLAEFYKRQEALSADYNSARVKSIEISRARILHAENEIRIAIMELETPVVLPSEQMAETVEAPNATE